MRRLTLLMMSAALLSGACGETPDDAAAARVRSTTSAPPTTPRPSTTVAAPMTPTAPMATEASTTTVSGAKTPTTARPAASTTTTLAGACPMIAAMPSEASDRTAAPVDFNGDATPDTLRVYRLGTAWLVRGEISGAGFDDVVVAHGGPMMAALGGARIDADATEEAWVNVGSGAYTDHVSFYAYRSCRLLAAGDGTEAAAFPVGASVRHAVGLTCTGKGTGFEAFTSSTDDGVLEEASSTAFALEVRGNAAVLVPGPSTPRRTAFSGFACGRLTSASAPGT
jgi:hypothetical protein